MTIVLLVLSVNLNKLSLSAGRWKLYVMTQEPPLQCYHAVRFQWLKAPGISASVSVTITWGTCLEARCLEARCLETRCLGTRCLGGRCLGGRGLGLQTSLEAELLPRTVSSGGR